MQTRRPRRSALRFRRSIGSPFVWSRITKSSNSFRLKKLKDLAIERRTGSNTNVIKLALFFQRSLPGKLRDD